MDKLFEQLHDSVQEKDYNKISDILADMSTQLSQNISTLSDDQKMSYCLVLLKSVLVTVEYLNVVWEEHILNQEEKFTTK